MGIEKLPGTDLHYYLISFDADGTERKDGNERVSSQLVELLKRNEITDVFLISHGWMADVPAAREQYKRWIGAMMECKTDINRTKARCPDFKPLIIGFHWPSLPWGEEEMSIGAVAFGSFEDSRQAWIDETATKVAGTAAARTALGTLFDAALRDPAPSTLPADVIDAYNTLYAEALGAVPDGINADMDSFDPVKTYRAQMACTVDFGVITGSRIFTPLIQLSFWTMKKRAQRVGEGAGAQLVARLQEACARKPARFHLMGHSFGCIVVSAMVLSRFNQPRICVDSLMLIQGALSLWSYALDIPPMPGLKGYFHPLNDGSRVRGAIITTHSEHDTAVGKLYPLAAGLAGPEPFDTALPKYGALGAFGAHGPGVNSVDMQIGSLAHSYGFKAGGFPPRQDSCRVS